MSKKRKMYESAYHYLKNKGLILYGNKISTKDICQALKIDFEDLKLNWGMVTNLCTKISSHGYWSTQRNCEPGEIYVLPIEEQSYEMQKVNKNTELKKKRKVIGMQNADITQLNEDNRKQHLHMIVLTNLSLQQARNILNDF